MRKEEMKNNEGDVLVTQDGVTMYEVVLEEGDELIPEYNSVMEKNKEITTSDGNTKKLVEHLIKAKIKDVNSGQVYSDEFIKLTDTQSKLLKNKLDQGVDINQNVFRVYSYTNDYGTFKGLGLKKDMKPAIDFPEEDE